MKRSFSYTGLGAGAGRGGATTKAIEVVRVEGDAQPGPVDGNLGFRALWEFIASLYTNPSLIRQSVECPDSVTIKYVGNRWVAESQVVVDAPGTSSGSAQGA